MDMKYLLDTNVIIYFLSGSFLNESSLDRLDEICRQGQHISIITKLELLGYNFASAKNESLAKEFVARSNVYQIDDPVSEKIISLRKTRRIKLPDAIIGATAIVNNLNLVTTNISDFKGIDGLSVANPVDW
jgi:predicted nucleic acid-binding protein